MQLLNSYRIEIYTVKWTQWFSLIIVSTYLLTATAVTYNPPWGKVFCHFLQEIFTFRLGEIQRRFFVLSQMVLCEWRQVELRFIPQVNKVLFSSQFLNLRWTYELEQLLLVFLLWSLPCSYICIKSYTFLYICTYNFGTFYAFSRLQSRKFCTYNVFYEVFK